MKYVVLVFILGIHVGCATYRVSQDLTKDLSEKGKTLASQTQLITGGTPESPIYLMEKTKKSFSSEGPNKLSILSVQKKYGPRERGFQCWEPYLHILTLGILPSICEQEYTIETQWHSETGQVENKSYTIYEKQIRGWIAMFINWFPSWKFGFSDTVDSAINTEINTRAEQ